MSLRYRILSFWHSKSPRSFSVSRESNKRGSDRYPRDRQEYGKISCDREDFPVAFANFHGRLLELSRKLLRVLRSPSYPHVFVLSSSSSFHHRHFVRHLKIGLTAELKKTIQIHAFMVLLHYIGVSGGKCKCTVCIAKSDKRIGVSVNNLDVRFSLASNTYVIQGTIRNLHVRNLLTNCLAYCELTVKICSQYGP